MSDYAKRKEADNKTKADNYVHTYTVLSAFYYQVWYFV